MGLDDYYRQLHEYYDGAKYLCDYGSLRRQIGQEHSTGFGFVQPVVDVAKQLLAGGNIIDVGCGIGKWCRTLATVANVTGIDFSPHLIEIARECTPFKNVKYLVDDVLSLQRLNETFTGASDFNVFNHVPWADWSRFIKTLHSKLEPGSPVVMGSQRLDAESRRKELTWIDDVPDPVQHNLKDGRTYYSYNATLGNISESFRDLRCNAVGGDDGMDPFRRSWIIFQQIRALAPCLSDFLEEFADCFAVEETRRHLKEYVQGQLSNLRRKSVEPIGHLMDVPPRTLQEFLSFSHWDRDRLRDTVQRIVARDHAEPQSIGIIDESGHPKKGNKTACVHQDYCGA
jgi:SAM-dependent methyltransferase